MTGDKMAGLHLAPRWLLGEALSLGNWTAGAEVAPGWGIGRIRDIPLQDDPLPLAFYVRVRHGDSG